MNIYAIAALAALGYVGVHAAVGGVKKLDHKVAHGVAKMFHRGKAKPPASK